MSNIISYHTYKSFGLDFETDENVPKLLNRAIELAKLYPHLSYHQVEHYGNEYIVFTKEPVEYEEAYEFVTHKKQILEKVKQVFDTFSEEEKQTFLNLYHDEEERTIHNWHDSKKWTCLGLAFYFSYRQLEIHYEENDEEYVFCYSKDEIKEKLGF